MSALRNRKFDRRFLYLIPIATMIALGYYIVSQGETGSVGHEMVGEVDIERSVAGLDYASESETLRLDDGAEIFLEAVPVKKRIGNVEVRMYGYDGSIPGPTMFVKQGSGLRVNFKNGIDQPTTVHWHGLRLDNEFDGVPGVTQDKVLPGESFTYELKFPDDGVYWYHPHVREDVQQEMGLYGNIIVEPADGYGEVDLEVPLILDDLKFSGEDLSPFDSDSVRFALMGRFGNLMLVNGETDYGLSVNKGDTVRFYLTNAASVRTFRFGVDGHVLRVVGGDSGRFEREFSTETVTIAPSERYIVEVLFNQTGKFDIVHDGPYTDYLLGTVEVSDDGSPAPVDAVPGDPDSRHAYQNGADEFRKYFDDEPAYSFQLDVDTSEMMMGNMGGHGGHGGMMGNDVDGIEWEDAMPMMNFVSSDKNVKWIIRDSSTGKSGEDMQLDAKVGDVRKIRIFNDPNSDHPMQHPIHLHGQRFLVLSVDGVENGNLVWKDTVLVPKGSTVDLLADFSNPGRWVFHCHIPEHMESGMMAFFDVAR